MSAEVTAVSQVLLPQEKAQLRELELVIEKGLQSFIKTGQALLEIRRSRLYREQYQSFEQYLRSRWAITISRAKQLIEAVELTNNLIAADTANEVILTHCNEHQLRPLTRLSPELQSPVWRVATALAIISGIDGT